MAYEVQTHVQRPFTAHVQDEMAKKIQHSKDAKPEPQQQQQASLQAALGVPKDLSAAALVRLVSCPFG